MIELLTIVGPDGRPFVRQKLAHPSVYLDTWAIRAFAEHRPQLGTRFRAALLATGGTFVMSTLSLVDFAGFSEGHFAAAGEFIDSLLPNVFFSRFEPFEVRNREYRIMAGISPGSPFGDEEMLRLFAEMAVVRGRLSIRGFFEQVYKHREQVRSFRTRLAVSVPVAIAALREYADSTPGVRSDMRNPLKNAEGPRSTNALKRMIFAEIEAPATIPTNPNSAIDMFQAIVPAAYCTYVLVDGEWDARIRRARTRAEAAGLQARIAASYSMRGNGLELFLADLEGRVTAQAV